MTSLRQWVRHRSRHGPSTHAHVSGQRRTALWLTIFALVRTVAWLVCMLLICVHWTGVGGPFLHGFISLSSSVIFVTFISFYCNASTDAANLMAGMSALFSADSHAAVIAGSKAAASADAELEADIARLAGLQPGPEGSALAAQICARLAAKP